jgi:hypothetical protein
MAPTRWMMSSRLLSMTSGQPVRALLARIDGRKRVSRVEHDNEGGDDGDAFGMTFPFINGDVWS